ncbi:MAG: hypothetical protein WA979_09500 [Pacificimonas sp.]
MTATEKKGFYLTVINPYDLPQRFAIRALDWQNEKEIANVQIHPNNAVVRANGKRRVLVIFTDLPRGEETRARICAQLDRNPEGVAIEARVCSKLTARRMP